MSSSSEELGKPSLNVLDKEFQKGTKGYLLALELAGNPRDLTHEERKELSAKYGVQLHYISNILTKIRKLGLWIDEPPPKIVTLHTDVMNPLPATPPSEIPPTPVPITIPPSPLTPNPTEAKLIVPADKTSPKDTQPQSSGNSTEGSTEELRNQIGKQEGMINNLQGQLKSVYDLMQRNQSVPAPTNISPAEEVPQVFEYPKDMLVRRVMWFVPKVLTLHQLYVEDAQKKGDVRPPTFVEWVNYMILETYRLRQMDLVLARPPQPVRSGLFGDAS